MSKWQTIEEFKANPVDGWCHVWYECKDSGNVWDIAFYVNNKFYWNDMVSNESYNLSDFNITHVMRIEDPVPPGNKYPFARMDVGDIKVLEFATDKDRQNAVYAAHQVGHRHGWKFTTLKRITDAGKSELTVKRVK
jgi:hypothetical protein